MSYSQHIIIHPFLDQGTKDVVQRMLVNGSYDTITEFNDTCIVVAADQDVVYVVDKQLLLERLQVVDVSLNAPSGLQPDAFSFDESRLRVNTVLSPGSFAPKIMYTFGNLFGFGSVLLGPKFRALVESPVFRSIMGRLLKEVDIHLGSDGQFKLVRYVIHHFGPWLWTEHT